MPPLPRKRVLIALHWYLEALHEGVLSHAREHDWEVLILNGETLGAVGKTRFDGILGMLPPADHPVHRFAAAAGVPVVELSPSYPENKHWGRYPSDGHATGKIATELLRRRPVASFAFVSTGTSPAHDLRREGFRKALAGDCRPFASIDTGGADPDSTRRLARFLAGLPSPVGIFGSVDASALLALNAAREAGLTVPDDAYILGFGDRRLISGMAPVPLTSIAVDYHAWGRAAAGLLDEMMSGRAAPGATRTFTPGAVIERASTGGDSGGHPLCARALALMSRHVAEPLEVTELAGRLGVSKATLDRAFAAAYGVGVAKRYRELRMEIAKGLLASGEKAESVAAAAGFASYRAFGKAFAKSTGRTPGRFNPDRRRAPGTLVS